MKHKPQKDITVPPDFKFENTVQMLTIKIRPEGGLFVCIESKATDSINEHSGIEISPDDAHDLKNWFRNNSLFF